VATSAAASAQGANPGGWADDNDPVAKRLIELERQWATVSCVPSATRPAAEAALYNELMADDFIGTSPSGKLYGKSDLMPQPAPAAVPEAERDCKFLGAKLRFFGPDLAVIYGRESAVRKDRDGKWTTRTLAWTDTVLHRAGKWQIVAVQDMAVRNAARE